MLVSTFQHYLLLFSQRIKLWPLHEILIKGLDNLHNDLLVSLDVDVWRKNGQKIVGQLRKRRRQVFGVDGRKSLCFEDGVGQRDLGRVVDDFVETFDSGGDERGKELGNLKTKKLRIAISQNNQTSYGWS